jgi:hypothetical protein
MQSRRTSLKKEVNVISLRLLGGVVVMSTWSLAGQSAGPVFHPNIAASTPIALPIISAQSTIKAGTPVKVHLILQNRSNRSIGLPPTPLFFPAIVFEVREGSDTRPPETKHGCQVHYFSSCYSPWRGGILGPALNAAIISAHQKIEIDALLDTEYDMSHPGTYTVVGYQDIVDENGNDAGIFKTNTIKTTVK